MTRLSRTTWWTVLVTAALGLLLSLVALAQAPRETSDVAEVRGAAAVGEAAPVRAPRSASRRSLSSGETVGRSEAAALATRERVTPPARVRVPAVGLDAPVSPVGVAAGRQMRLPDDPRVLGWYRFGPAPGSGTGSAVLAGHVDSREYGVGPLARLGEVRPGDVVEVRLAQGRRTAYRVDSVERFDQQALPDAVFARSGPERLRLITCTGPYLPEQGGYQQNLVVTAVPV